MSGKAKRDVSSSAASRTGGFVDSVRSLPKKGVHVDVSSNGSLSVNVSRYRDAMSGQFSPAPRSRKTG